VTVGDIVVVSGYVTESEISVGLTGLVACTFEKTGAATVLMQPIELTTDAFPSPYHDTNNPGGTACTEAAEGYEGMLVTITDPVIQCCADAHGYSNNAPYDDRCQGNIDVSWGSVWDVYKQFYVKSAGATAILDVDNHMYSAFTTYYTRCDDGSNTPDQWTSITGVIGWWHGSSGDTPQSPRWDLAPRNEFDVVGATPISTDDVRTLTIAQAKNALAPMEMFGNDFDAIPANLLGTAEVNSDGEAGTACFGAEGTELWQKGSCPRSDIMNICRSAGSRPQSICNCYPLNTYSSVAAAGSEYVYMYGTVTHVQDATGPFYFEDACGVGNGLYVYRNDDATALAVGDYIRGLFKLYHYYGLDEATDPIEVAIISTNQPLCPPAEITAAPFQDVGHGDCSREAEVIEGTRVTMRYVTVTRIFNSNCMDDDPDAADIQWQGGYSGGFCPPGCDKCWGSYLQGYWDGGLSDSGLGDDYTAIEIMDQHGHKMVLDQARDNSVTPLTPYYLGTVRGHEGQTLQVGDVFEYVTGFVDHRRGSYSTEYGGYYAFVVKEIGAWNPPPPAGDGGSKKKKSSGLSGGALIAVVVICVVVALVVGGICLIIGAKFHRAVDRNTNVCKPEGDVKLELVEKEGAAPADEEVKA